MSDSRENKGLVSCVIPVYNRQELIVECVQSVLSQTYHHYEIIIVNDGSTDQTADVLANLAQQYPQKIRVLNQSNQGPGAARQLGLDHAQGEYIQFLDSDDLLLPEKFELFINAFSDHHQPDIVYATTHYYPIDDPENHIVWKQTNQPIESLLPRFFLDRIWGTATPIYKHSILKQAGKILPLSCEEDLEYECRIGLQNPKLIFIDQHLTDIRHHSGNRFSVHNSNRAKQLSHQIQAREHIYQTMIAFGLDQSSQQMQDFSKFMFLLARQSGELNLFEASSAAFKLAKISNKGLSKKDRLAMEIYRTINLVAGRKKGSQLFSVIYNGLHKIKN